MSQETVSQPGGAGPRNRLGTIFVGVVVVAVIYLATSRTSPPPPAAFEWASDHDAALARAAAEKRPVLLTFSAAWCGACRMMDRDVYARPEAGALLRRWLPVRVDADAQQALVSRYQIAAVPTLLMLSPDGKVIDRYDGPLTLSQLAEAIARAEASMGAGGASGT